MLADVDSGTASINDRSRLETHIGASSGTWCSNRWISWSSSRRPRPRRSRRSPLPWCSPAAAYRCVISPRQRDRRKSGSAGNAYSWKTDPSTPRSPCFEVSDLREERKRKKKNVAFRLISSITRPSMSSCLFFFFFFFFVLLSLANPRGEVLG